MASAPKDADDDGTEKENAIITTVEASCSSLKQRSSTGTNANIYTPLLMSNKSSNNSALLPTQTIALTSDDNEILKKETLKPVSIGPKKQVSKTTNGLPSQSSRVQRSSVRPFFCCGSELSLVSLVDGLELKDTSTKEKKITSIECSSSSEEEESALGNMLSRTSSASFSSQGISAVGERRHTVVRRKKKDKQNAKKKFWSLRFRGRWNPRWRVSQPQRCISHRCDHSHHSLSSGCQGTYQSTESPGSGRRSPRSRPVSSTSQLIDLSRVQEFDRLYPIDDIDTIRRRERAEEMASGVEVDPQLLSRTLRQNLGIPGSMLDMLRSQNRLGSANSDTLLHSPDSPTEDYSLLMSNIMWQWHGPRNNSVTDGSSLDSPRIHTQVDFIHCLVPCLINILACPFYWGVMDRYEAERLLDNKPEGTFLLRDSAQEDFLFSVSFRRYNRSLHARVEQWNHRFSFDAHDPAVFSAPSVCELMEHYKDPSCCMFFEPMLTQPLPRNFPFSLQHICRAVICDRLGYDQIRSLPLPNGLKQFLQVYHYKQKVRVRRFDGPEVAYADTIWSCRL